MAIPTMAILTMAILTIALLTMATFGASASDASFQKLEGITKDIFSRSPGRSKVSSGEW